MAAEIRPVGQADRERLYQMFERNTFHASLKLYRKGLRDNAMPVLLDYLREHPQIDKLNLKRNKITAAGARVIRDILLDPLLKIYYLDLSMNQLKTAGIRYIAEAVELSKSLRTLFVTKTGIDAVGAEALGIALKSNQKLTGLGVDQNTFLRETNPKGRMRLADGVNTNGRIKVLTLSSLQVIRVNFVRHLIQTEMPNKRMTDCVLRYSHDQNNEMLKYITAQWRDCKARGVPLIPLPQELLEQVAEASKKQGDDWQMKIDETLVKIKTFMEASSSKDRQMTMKRAKMLIVGAARAGKSSLTDSLIANRSVLTGEGEGRATLCVQIKPWQVEGMVCSMYDFGGQEEYYMTHSFFVSPRAIVMIVVNLADYELTDECYNSRVQYWIDAIQAHAPGAKYLIVGTHADLIPSPQEIQDKTEHIADQFRMHERRIRESIEEQIMELEPSKPPLQEKLSSLLSLPHMDGEDSLHYVEPDSVVVPRDEKPKGGLRKATSKGLGGGLMQSSRTVQQPLSGRTVMFDDMKSDFEDEKPDDLQLLQGKLDQRPMLIYGSVFSVSCEANAEGLDFLVRNIKEILKHPLEHGASVEFPTSYVRLTDDINKSVSELGASPIMTLTELGKKYTGKKKLFSNQDKLEAALELLHNTGYVLWYKNIPTLNDIVFLSPQWVVDMIKSVIRHDMFTNRIDALQSITQVDGLSAEELEEAKRRFRADAILDIRVLYRLGIWASSQVTDRERVKMLFLMNNLDLLTFLPENEAVAHSEVFIPLYLKPSFKDSELMLLKPKIPKDLASLFIGQDRQYEAEPKQLAFADSHVQYRYLFANFYPEGVFLRLLVKVFAYAALSFEGVTDTAAKFELEGECVIHVEEQRNYTGHYGEELPGALLITAICYDGKSHYSNSLALFNCEVETLLRSFPGLEVGVFLAFMHEELGKVIVPRDRCEQLQLLKVQNYVSSGEDLSTDEIKLVLGRYRVPLTQLLPEVYKGDEGALEAPMPVRRSFFGRTVAQLQNLKEQISSASKKKNTRLRVLHLELSKIIEQLLRMLCKTVGSGGNLIRGWDNYFKYLKRQKLKGFLDISAEVKNLRPFEEVLFDDKRKIEPIKPSRLDFIQDNAIKLLQLLKEAKRASTKGGKRERATLGGVGKL